MVKLDFEVNKVALLITILRKYSINEQGKAIKNQTFKALQNNPEQLNLMLNAVKRFTNHANEYKSISSNLEMLNSLKTVFNSEEFLTLYDESEKYRLKVQEKWNNLEPKVRQYFSEKLGIKEDKRIKVNVVNPKFNTGTNNLKDEIFWGHFRSESEPYYDVVYMMHESLHCLYPYKKNWNLEQCGICHGLIELATDNELRCLLEGNIQNYSEGHQDNNLRRNKLLPIWCAFLGKSEEEIEVLKKLQGADFSNYNKLLENKTIKQMNFSNLMDYCIENYRHFEVKEIKKYEYEH